MRNCSRRSPSLPVSSTTPSVGHSFAGEEKNLVVDVVKTAVAENLQGTPEDWQRRVLAWAKENGSGEYRPGYWEGYELSWEYKTTN